MQLLVCASFVLFAVLPAVVTEQCRPGEEDDCSKCYSLLVANVTDNDRNLFNLTNAFFPPNTFPPDFVTVIYHYKDDFGEEIDTQIWYWSTSTYNLLHPAHVFQFISLLLSKLASEVHLTLHQNCQNASEDHMRLLAQRLKNFTSPVGESYIPTVESVAEIKEWHNNNKLLGTIMFSTHFLTPFILWVILLMAVTCINDMGPNPRIKRIERIFKRGTNRKKRELKYQLQNECVMSIVFVLYTFILSILAIDFGRNTEKHLHEEVSKYLENNLGFPSIYFLSFIPLVQDGVILISMILSLLLSPWMVTGIVGFIILSSAIIVPILALRIFLLFFTALFGVCLAADVYCHYNCSKTENNKSTCAYSETRWWKYCAYSSYFPLACLMNHLNYIISAFIHNPYHARDNALIYGVVGILIYMMLDRLPYWLQFFLKSCTKTPDFEDKAKYWIFLFVIKFISVIIILYLHVVYVVPINFSFDIVGKKFLSTVALLLTVYLLIKKISINNVDFIDMTNEEKDVDSAIPETTIDTLTTPTSDSNFAIIPGAISSVSDNKALNLGRSINIKDILKEEGFPASAAMSLAGCLGIARSEVLVMMKNHHQDAEGLLGSVIDEWTSFEEPSYARLSEAVRKCGYPEIAKKIEENNAEIIGEVTILYQEETIYLNWEDHGFRLSIPDNALPHGVTSCLIRIKAFLSCEYVIPDAGKADLVSGIYHISSTHSFTKPVTLHIQHFSRNTKSLCFGINSDLKYPYKFDLVDNGYFNDSSYGVLSVRSFSIFGTFKRITGYLRRQEYKYRSRLLYSTTIKNRYILEWNVYFLIIKDSNLFYKYVKQYLIEEENITIQSSKSVSQPIEFAEEKISLQLPDEGFISGDWRLQCLVPPVIPKSEVNNFNKKGQHPPMCQLHLTCSNHTREMFQYQLSLDGARGSNKYFRMRMCVPSQGEMTQRFAEATSRYSCSCFIIILSVLVAIVAAGVAMYIIIYSAPSSLCTEIKQQKDLEKVLAYSSIKLGKMCSDLGIMQGSCIELVNDQNLIPNGITQKYFQQNPSRCWENIIKVVCEDFRDPALAMNNIVKDHEATRPAYNKYCLQT